MEASERGAYGVRGEAHLHQEAGRSTWRVEFSVPGFGQFKKRFPNHETAKIAASRANAVLPMIRAGHLETPAGATKGEVRDFVLNGGKRTHAPPLGLPKPSKATGDLIDAFLTAPQPEKAASTLCTEKVHLRHLRRFLDERGLLAQPLTAITAGILKEYRTDRLKVVGPVTTNKEVATIDALLSQCVHEGLIPENPAADLPRLKIPELPEFQTLDEIEHLLRVGVFTQQEDRRLRRARILYPAEILDLLRRATGLPIEVPLAVAAYTGGRRGEVARITWADVSFSTEELTLRSRKQSKSVDWKPRRIHMHSSLERVLRAHHAHSNGEGYLFPGHRRGSHVSPKTLHEWLRQLVVDTPFVGIGWHTLRHSLASNMARAGEDPRVINKIMGHTGDEMARRYMHLFPQQRQDAIEAAWNVEAAGRAS